MTKIKSLSLAAGFGAALALTFAGPAMAQDAAAPAAAHDTAAAAPADDTAADPMGGHKGKKDVDIKSDNDMSVNGEDQFCNAQGFVVIIKNSCNGNGSDNSANGIGGDWDGDVDSNES